MRAKAAQVKERMQQRVLRRRGALAGEHQAPKGYRVIAISLYSDQADSVDRATEVLLEAGHRRASRSLVIQTAIERLQEELSGKTRNEVLQYFVERQLRRPLATARARWPRRAGHAPEQLSLLDVASPETFE